MRVIIVCYMLIVLSVVLGVEEGLNGISTEIIGDYEYILSKGKEGARSIVTGVGGTYKYIEDETLEKLEEEGADYTKVSMDGLYKGIVVRGVEGSGGLEIKSGKHLTREGEVLIGEELSKLEGKEEGSKLELQGEEYEIVGVVKGGGLGIWKMGVEGSILGVMYNEIGGKEIIKGDLRSYNIKTLKGEIEGIKEGEWLRQVKIVLILWYILTILYLGLKGVKLWEVLVGVLLGLWLLPQLEPLLNEYLQGKSMYYEGKVRGVYVLIPLLIIVQIVKSKSKKERV